MLAFVGKQGKKLKWSNLIETNANWSNVPCFHASMHTKSSFPYFAKVISSETIKTKPLHSRILLNKRPLRRKRLADFPCFKQW